MSYQTISDTITAETVIKKSRFICILTPLLQSQDIDLRRDEARQKYPGANHYCFAYRLRQSGSILERYSDDGEPGGTAGRPMLAVLAQNHLENSMSIVIRYFGGTLLGTGGLVKAYTSSVQAALEQAKIASMVRCQKLNLTLDYNYYGSFEKYIQPIITKISDIEYADHIKLEVWVTIAELTDFQAKLNDLSAGTASIELAEQAFIPAK